MTDLNKAVVLITGASGGFGQALVQHLLAKNSRLILTDVKQQALEQLSKDLAVSESSGEVLACIEADLASKQGLEHLYREVDALNQPVDVLINNAGVALFGRHDQVPREEWSLLMQLNLLTPMDICAHFMPKMIARKSGHIVNISSVAGWIAPSGLSAYGASKFGLRGFSEAIADELSRYKVNVTAVYPYFSRTPILNSKSYGVYAKRKPIPDKELTDPVLVMAKVVEAIESNQSSLFPDKRGKQLQFVKRIFPGLLKWIGKRL